MGEMARKHHHHRWNIKRRRKSIVNYNISLLCCWLVLFFNFLCFLSCTVCVVGRKFKHPETNKTQIEKESEKNLLVDEVFVFSARSCTRCSGTQCSQ
jgi:hypothetical protein